MKVLIVDDDPDTRIYLATLLHNFGYATLEADTGDSGLQTALKQRPALIIVDAMIQTGSSTTLYCDIRLDQHLRQTPVIMLSSVTASTYAHYQKIQNKLAGQPIPEPEAYLTKPPEAEELLNQVRRLLPGSGGDRSEDSFCHSLTREDGID